MSHKWLHTLDWYEMELNENDIVTGSICVNTSYLLP